MRRRRKVSPGTQEQKPNDNTQEVSPNDDHLPKELQGDNFPEEGLKAREGDVLTVTFEGAKLSLASDRYSNVSVDGSSYTRVMREGEDVSQVWQQMYEFLYAKCTTQARRKFQTFNQELERAKNK